MTRVIDFSEEAATTLHIFVTSLPQNVFDSIQNFTTINDLSSLFTKLHLSARGVMVIVVGNGDGDTSSNPGRY